MKVYKDKSTTNKIRLILILSALANLIKKKTYSFIYL